jgi:hypothetical protein
MSTLSRRLVHGVACRICPAAAGLTRQFVGMTKTLDTTGGDTSGVERGGFNMQSNMDADQDIFGRTFFCSRMYVCSCSTESGSCPAQAAS